MESRAIQHVMAPAVAWYREFAPCDALRADIHAFFSFVPLPFRRPHRRRLLREVSFERATFCSPQFANGDVSMVFELGRACDAAGRWHIVSTGFRGTVVGPMSEVGRTERVDTPEMLGVYFRPARADRFLRAPIAELTDRAVTVDDLWGGSAARLATELRDLDESQRIDRLEAVLLKRLRLGRAPTGSVAVEQLAAHVIRRRGLETVEGMASAAGVSRQHLSRIFRERVGVGPKLYCRLARFHAGLAYVGAGEAIDWAEKALDLGYADQSHMIAEFRRFSSLTPHALAGRQSFHPFIERARGQIRVATSAV
jgi:AraC-like DNA-binding protein